MINAIDGVYDACEYNWPSLDHSFVAEISGHHYIVRNIQTLDK